MPSRLKQVNERTIACLTLKLRLQEIEHARRCRALDEAVTATQFNTQILYNELDAEVRRGKRLVAVNSILRDELALLRDEYVVVDNNKT